VRERKGKRRGREGREREGLAPKYFGLLPPLILVPGT